jgi:hypothetical protein
MLNDPEVTQMQKGQSGKEEFKRRVLYHAEKLCRKKKIYNIYIGRQKKKNVGENKNSIWILAKVCNCQ